jgi:diguanylate cyclase (GGDEF)-like protein
MSKFITFEKIYIKFVFGLSIIGILLSFVSNTIMSLERVPYNKTFFDLAFYIMLIVLSYIKMKLIGKGTFEKESLLLKFRYLETIILIAGAVFVTVDSIPFLILLVFLILTSIFKGRKVILRLLGVGIALHIIFRVSAQLIFPGEESFPDIIQHLYDFIYYIGTIVFVLIASTFYAEIKESDDENKRLMSELEDKYQQLEIAENESKKHINKLKETNMKLEEANKKLTSSVAEFFTLQQISNAISSIFDTNELLKFVNDIILGVMGTNNSTIILYDEDRNRLRIQTTNISERKELAIINDNINCKVLLDVLESSQPIVENFIDHEEYIFAKGREVNSLICIPLTTKSHKIGLVLIENKFNNTFDDDNVRLMNIISQQVGIAMENAILYQKMHELATTDSLTKIYNRLHFQERLSEELEIARKNDYRLSLSIFDIDHFKKFNDTYGHLFGDRVLIEITKTVKSMLRESDIFARFGGEEFVILFPRMNSEETYKKLESIRKKIESTQVKDQLISASVTVSFGISAYPETSVSDKEMISNADDALYEAKEAGRNRVIISKSNPGQT